MSVTITRSRLVMLAAASVLALGIGSAGAQQNQQDRNQNQMRQQQGDTQKMQRGQRQARQQQGDRSIRHPMQYQQVRGTIQDIRRVDLPQGGRTTLVLLETEQGDRAVADLGTTLRRVRLQEGEELSVRGTPVNLGDRRIILQASNIHYQDRVYDLNRPAHQRQGMAGQGDARQMRQGRQQQDGRQQAGRQQQGGMQLAAFNRVDRDQSGDISQQEFARRMRQTGLFDQIDRNSDGQLSTRELAGGLYAMWDANNNGILSLTEWDRGIDRTFGETDIQLDPAEWDQDDDQRITRREFRAGLNQSDLLAEMDIQGDQVSKRGFYRVVFQAADRNNDQSLTQGEYRQLQAMAQRAAGGSQQAMTGRQRQQDQAQRNQGQRNQGQQGQRQADMQQ